MTLAEKADFVAELIDSVHAKILDRMERLPADWDGHELRQLLADCFAREVVSSIMRGRRLKDYRNAVLVNNLD